MSAPTTTFALGKASLARLSSVHPDLVRVVKRAIAITEQDFTVFEGLRSLETQKAYLARGATRTLKSRHLKQPDGFGHAVDLVPWIAGGPRWEWPPIYDIAAAMREAAIAEQAPLIWGGAWDRRLNLLQEGPAGIKAEVAAYCVRHPGPDFIDGPHYQLAG